MMNKQIDVVKQIIGSDHLVVDVIDNSVSTSYVRYGVNIDNRFIPILTYQSGYDVVHGNFKKTSIMEVSKHVSKNYPASAYLITKSKCVTATDLVKVMAGSVASDTLDVWWSNHVSDYVESLEVTVASKDFKSLLTFNFNNKWMQIHSYKKLNAQRKIEDAISIGLIA